MSPPLHIALLVEASPHSHRAATTALRFARAAVAAGQRLSRVFFFGDGVLAARPHAGEVADEPDPAAQWSALAAESDIDLVVCVAAAQRRGIDTAALAEGFRIGGLGQLIEAGIDADRLVSFGD